MSSLLFEITEVEEVYDVLIGATGLALTVIQEVDERIISFGSQCNCSL